MSGLVLVVAGAAGLASCCPVACDPTTPASLPVCVENFGPGVVQVKWENVLGCDVVPPQRLTVVFDAESWGRGAWGGDASLAWATATCEDMGGTPIWHAATWLECDRVDY